MGKATPALHPTRKLRIGVDVDGCVYPWTRAVNDAVIQRFGIPDPGEHACWEYLQQTLTKRQWEWAWSRDAVDVVFGRLDLIYPGAAEAVNALCHDHEVHFVTHRNPRRVTGLTGQWLNYHFRNYVGVHVLNARCAKRTLGKWDVFVDDKAETILDFWEHGEPTMLFAPARPWNAALENHPGVHRFEDWLTVPAVIENNMRAKG